MSPLLEVPGKFLANGGHAQQDIPSQHRLLNAGVMFVGWYVMDQLRQTMFGVRMKSEGEYVEVKKEDVPLPLQFLHKSIDWDPHSETPDNQWKKLMYQCLPGLGAGVGGITGSIYAFQRNGREQTNKNLKLKGVEKLNMLDADYVAQFAQSQPLRLLAAFFGTFSAASGLTFLYGAFLNPAFASSNGAKIFAGSLAKGNAGPEKAVAAQFESLGSYVNEALKTGKMSEGWANKFTDQVLEPLFGHELKTPEAHAQAVKSLQEIVDKSFQRFRLNGKPAKEIAAAVTKDLESKLGKAGLDKTVKAALGLDPKNARVGYANPIFHAMQDFLSDIGLMNKYSVGKKATSGNIGYAAAIGGAGAVAAMATLGDKQASPLPLTAAANDDMNAEGHEAGTPPVTTVSHTTSTPASATSATAKRHMMLDPTGRTPAEYATDAMTFHNQQYGGAQPPGILKWFGEAQLAVLPKNRILCAIGLTAGLMIAGNMAKIATGYGLDKKKVDISKVPTYLQDMVGVVKDYDPSNMLKLRNRLIYYGQWAAYSLGGFMGIKMGTDFAYQNVSRKNADPHYLEDHLPRISMHQGENWSLLSAFAGIFGSASGLFALPIPGLNYGLGLAGRTTSMQDRNFMIAGLGEMMSGNKTTSFMRLREGMNYMCHYAVGSPAETPSQFEFLAYALLAPVFKDKLTTAHIQHFTEAVHSVRDRYWQEGGIPKEKKAEALKAMREVFSGAGLEVLLIDMGLNPATVKFDELNGMVGTIGNIGILDKIHGEQKHYQEELSKRLPTFVKEHVITQEQADWVNAGIEAFKHKQPEPAAPAPRSAAPQQHHEMAAEQTEEVPGKKFADKEKTHKDAISDLLKKAEERGDWRRAAQLSKESRAPAPVGG